MRCGDSLVVSTISEALRNFDSVKNAAAGSGPVAQAARQYLQIYEEARGRQSPTITILELGTRDGVSTSVFLRACEERGGVVVSVDIADCSSVSDSNNWQFVQSDSTDISKIVAAAPILRDGIDILLIDSLHRAGHVEKELFGWFEFLKEDGIAIFDDIDPFVYRQGQRKDNVFNEVVWQDIQDFVNAVFRANENSLSLSMHFGSTGLAVLRKREDIRVLQRPSGIVYRDRSCWYALKKWLIRRAVRD